VSSVAKKGEIFFYYFTQDDHHHVKISNKQSEKKFFYSKWESVQKAISVDDKTFEIHFLYVLNSTLISITKKGKYFKMFLFWDLIGQGFI